MFALNIAVGNVAWRLLFKDEEKAQAAYMRLTNFDPTLCHSIEDDFGQKFSGKSDMIAALMLEDLSKTKHANIELFLHQKRVEAMAVKAAQSDPALRAAAMMNGPSVIDPMGAIMRPAN